MIGFDEKTQLIPAAKPLFNARVKKYSNVEAKWSLITFEIQQKCYSSYSQTNSEEGHFESKKYSKNFHAFD